LKVAAPFKTRVVAGAFHKLPILLAAAGVVIAAIFIFLMIQR
jgi:hypothetical protein